MAATLSLTNAQLETLCQTYHQTLELASGLEWMESEFSELIREFSKPDTPQLRVLRTFLMILLREKWGGFVDVHTISQAEKISERQVERDLTLLREAQVVQRIETASKGKWAVPGSRMTKRGRPPAPLVVNPALRGDYVNYKVNARGESSHEFVSAAKFLQNSPGFRSAIERILSAHMKIGPYVLAFMEEAKKIPEINEIVKRYHLEPPSDVSRFKYIVAKEIARTALLKSQILFDEEGLPREEERRLGIVLDI